MADAPKIGAGHAAAMGRLGLKELRNAVTPSQEGIATDELGLYGTKTQGEIAADRADAGPEIEGELPMAEAEPSHEQSATGPADAEVAAEIERMSGGQEQSRGR